MSEQDVEAQANTALEIAREIINGEREVSTGPRCMTSWEQSLLAREVARLSGEREKQQARIVSLTTYLDAAQRSAVENRNARVKAEGEREQLREAIKRARHELDQWVFADGSAAHRVARAEEILDAALSAGTEQEEPDAADMADPHWSGGHPHA